jgi:hypothetical protein
MGFQFCDSFDCYDVTASFAKKWTTVGADFVYSATGGRFGGGCLSNTSGGAYAVNLVRNLTIVSGATMYFAGWFQISGLSSPGLNQGILAVNSGNTQMVGYNASGQMILTALGGSTAIATGTTVISDGAYHWIEVSIKLNGASSSSTCYVDGVQQWTGSSYNISAAAAITSVYVGLGYNFNSGPNSIDDVIIWDDQGSTFNTFPLGPRRIACLNPSAAGANTNFTPSTGTNWSCASQAYAGTKTLISITSGQVDTYDTAGLSYAPTAVINAVVVNSSAQNPAADGTKHLINQLLSSGTLATGTNRVLTASLATFQDCFTTDSTSAAWTASSVASAQPGIGD